ncbi:cytosine/adenosine deaminase-related metal-dependent hydrolase [Thermocatellispora tengchongensis]|uniref:Cytosine/adenosine deaminase-related metal-dependent hydrolase n=1 Tax=Thermocatellispora tengchongensis TaxID=1073253 RepID=A0A840PAY6_9ACTN|nr:cytosine/adenosine deaminase-related metal-dependent hydrolase [Thermocatellispora tengchongensis]
MAKATEDAADVVGMWVTADVRRRGPLMNADDTTSAAVLERLQRRSADPRRRILFTGATIVTMDPALGVLDRGDLLVEGDTIAAVGPALSADDAVVVESAGTIVAPGFIDTHRHAWEAQLRRIMPDVDDLAGYVMATLAGYARAYRPEDMYIGTKLAALTAIDSGITCMLDFSHNSRSAEHSDAAIQALLDTGIRGVHASMGPHFGDWDRQWPSDLRRLKSQYFSSDDQLLTLRVAALATDEIAGPALAYGPDLARVAQDLGIGVSVDAVFGTSSSEAVLRWAEEGILNPGVTLIHATGLTTEAWKTMAATGTTVALAPTSDAQIGLETAIPAVDEALSAGIRPGLSIDVEVALASDMFTQMRALHAIQRMRRQRLLRHRPAALPDHHSRRTGLRNPSGRPHQRTGEHDRFTHPRQEGRPPDHPGGSPQQHAAQRPCRHCGPGLRRPQHQRRPRQRRTPQVERPRPRRRPARFAQRGAGLARARPERHHQVTLPVVSA